MGTQDAAKARARFLAANRRITEGLRVQRHRIVDRASNAPRLTTGAGVEVVDLRGDLGNDLDYYIYELARLQDLARAICSAFGGPPEIVGGLHAFESAIPALRTIRNPLTHPSDDERLDGVAWFVSVVKLQPHGEVVYLVDPRYGDHDAANELSRVMTDYLEAGAPPDGPEGAARGN